MAVALHRNLGTEFLLLCERSGDYLDPDTGKPVASVHHVYASLSDGSLLDIRGEHNSENVTSNWLSLGDERRSNPFKVIEATDEKALRKFVDDGWNLPLTSYTDEAVAQAWEVFQAVHPSLAVRTTLIR